MKRRFRLTSSTEFKRVRQLGKSYAHPLVVLVVLPNGCDHSRFAVAAGRSLGNAVIRNRAKRRLRELIRPMLTVVAPGWDALFLARRPMNNAPFEECRAAVVGLLKRAHLLQVPQ